MNKNDRLPDDFSERAARKALDGNAEAIWEAFVWENTPQGHSFWSKRAYKLDEKARKILLNWLELYKEQT